MKYQDKILVYWILIWKMEFYFEDRQANQSLIFKVWSLKYFDDKLKRKNIFCLVWIKGRKFKPGYQWYNPY